MVRKNHSKDDVTMEEKELQTCIYLIGGGNLYFVDTAIELAQRHRNYEKELEKAIRTGEKIELQKYINWIKGRYLGWYEVGGTWFKWIDEAKKLADKHLEHKDELKESIRIGGEIRLPKYIRWIEAGELSNSSLIDKIKTLVYEYFPEYQEELERAIRICKEKKN